MSKQKRQGTKHETSIVKRLHEQFCDCDTPGEPPCIAFRLAEGGVNDRGDIAFLIDGPDQFPLIIEARARQAMSIHPAVAKANSKAGLSRSVVWWKRLTPSKGGRRRSPDGVAEVVAMDYATFLWLLERGQ